MKMIAAGDFFFSIAVLALPLMLLDRPAAAAAKREKESGGQLILDDA